MCLTVLSVAYPFAPVGPRAVGGAEVVLGELDRALVRAGHRSRVVAADGSRVRGELFPVPRPSASLDAADRGAAVTQVDLALCAALQADRPADLVHMHGIDFHRYRVPGNAPVLVTLHMPPGWYPAEVWQRFGPRYRFQFVSQTQKASGPEALRSAPVIVNGVALPRLDPTKERGDFALALGRICPEKNLHEALEAGTRAGVRVLIGGQVFPYAEHLAYFREQIEPRLGGPLRHRFLGPLSPRRKRALLARARWLLAPTIAPETSSLVAMEAFAAGTPVIAYRSGALPEIVEHGRTGWLVEGVDAMAAAIRRTGELDAAVCRRTAVERFSRRRMAAEYLELYGRILRGEA